MANIKKIVDNLIAKFGTSNIYKILEFSEVLIYYSSDIKKPSAIYQYGVRSIALIPGTHYLMEEWILAHELGHFLLHDNMNIYEYNYLESENCKEIEANLFAYYLLSCKDELHSLSFIEVCNYYNIPSKIIAKIANRL